MKLVGEKNNINKLIIDAIRPYQLENLEELVVIYDGRKSFYKKAYIGTFNFDNNKKICRYLKSYDTIVAGINGNELRIYGWFSETTARHIREFAKQNGFDDKITKSDMLDTCVIIKEEN